ncbi:MAG: biotin--[Blautia sp.]|nr:biotin--[acetyl-CoA-carboxylase] ligase [Blautia sp.]
MSVKSELLKLLEAHRGETVSGEAAAELFSCSRTAIWKAVNSLRREGYQIEAGPNRGYCLADEESRLSEEGMRLYLRDPDGGTVETNGRERRITVLEQTGSTNLEARKALLEGRAASGDVIAARFQTEGRGRRGKSFFSPAGGIYLSIILQPHTTIRDSLLLTTAAAAAVFKAVKKVCAVSLDIKWVNDLYLNGRKVCGILTEAMTDFESGAVEAVIVGIGLNVWLEKEQLPDELKETAGGLFADAKAGRAADRNLLAAQIVNEFLELAGKKSLAPEYVERNLVPGHRILITDGDFSREARAAEILPDGRLRVLEKDGTEGVLSFGEIRVLD